MKDKCDESESEQNKVTRTSGDYEFNTLPLYIFFEEKLSCEMMQNQWRL